MCAYFIGNDTKEYCSQDGSLKLGRLHACMLILSEDFMRSYRKTLGKIKTIEGLTVAPLPFHSGVGLKKDILDNEEKVQQVMIQVQQIIDEEPIAKAIIQAIESLTNFKHHSRMQISRDQSENPTPSLI